MATQGHPEAAQPFDKSHYGITTTDHEVALCEMSRRAPAKSIHGMLESD
jgi:hypothetical protein